jgi:hypothetical protein
MLCMGMPESGLLPPNNYIESLVPMLCMGMPESGLPPPNNYIKKEPPIMHSLAEPRNEKCVAKIQRYRVR